MENAVASTLIQGKIRTSVNKKDGKKEMALLNLVTRQLWKQNKKLQVNRKQC